MTTNILLRISIARQLTLILKRCILYGFCFLLILRDSSTISARQFRTQAKLCQKSTRCSIVELEIEFTAIWKSANEQNAIVHSQRHRKAPVGGFLDTRKEKNEERQISTLSCTNWHLALNIIPLISTPSNEHVSFVIKLLIGEFFFYIVIVMIAFFGAVNDIRTKS